MTDKLTETVERLRDAARWLVDHASHHGEYAAIDQDHIDGLRDAVNAYDLAALTPPVGEDEVAYREAVALANALWKKHYRGQAPDWKPLDDLSGVISQIDNMAAGLSRPNVDEMGLLRDAADELGRIAKCNDEADTKYGGLADSTDNSGQAYQSQELSNCFARTRPILAALRGSEGRG